MAQIDITREALLRSVETIKRTRQLVRKKMPYGPNMGVPSTAELRKALRQPSPSLMQSLIEEVGEDKALELLVGARSR